MTRNPLIACVLLCIHVEFLNSSVWWFQLQALGPAARQARRWMPWRRWSCSGSWSPPATGWRLWHAAALCEASELQQQQQQQYKRAINGSGGSIAGDVQSSFGGCSLVSRRYNGSHDSSGLCWFVLKPNPTQPNPRGWEVSLELKQVKLYSTCRSMLMLLSPWWWLTYHDIL